MSPIGENKSGRGHTEKHGGRVPTFNIHGQHHHRIPFKDKQYFLNTSPHLPWTRQPAYNSRTDLMQARKTHMVPHKSYDFDGDGVVGQRDYFIGKHFDEDHDDRLNTGERTTAEKALQEGWLDKFNFGLDQSGAARKFPIQQRRGIIISHDNGDEMGDTYPKHFNADKAPNHMTQTEMFLDRRGEMRGIATKNKERWDMENPVFVPPNPVSQEFRVENPMIDHIGQRADADHQKARVKAGLLPCETYENPERQRMTLGLAGGYVQYPMARTRSQLLDTRKEVHRRQIEEQVLESEQHHIPYSVRVARREAACFEFRKPENAFTCTKLKQRRKEDRIEYDFENFGHKPKIYPRYSDQPHPWWSLVGDEPDAGARVPSAPARVPPLEPAFKITEKDWPPGRDERVGTAPAQMAGLGFKEKPLPDEDTRMAPEAKKKEGELGANTKKRWTSELIEAGHTRNAPRYFDSLKPAQTYARDFEPLDNLSSFDLIKEDSLALQAKSRADNRNKPPASKISTIQTAATRSVTGSRGGTGTGMGSRQGTGDGGTRGPSRQRSAPSLGGTHESSGQGSRSREGTAININNKANLPFSAGGLGFMARAGTAPEGLRPPGPGPSMMERAQIAADLPSKAKEAALPGARPPRGGGKDLTNPPGVFFGAGISGFGRTVPPGNWGVRSGGFQRVDETRSFENAGAGASGLAIPAPDTTNLLGSRGGTAVSNTWK